MAYPKNVGERTLLYVAETFEQLEGLIQLFERMDNEENDIWWDKLANELGFNDEADNSVGSGEYDDDSDSDGECGKDSPTAADKQTN